MGIANCWADPSHIPRGLGRKDSRAPLEEKTRSMAT
uniref:Uncharacterized protein n=1 Tax=Arundo donax TaxID=35708 RepID=A0A0A9D3H2_ARUDO